MKGSVLKERLKNEGINLSDLSKRLGYNTDQNLHSVLGAADVKSSLLENISRVLGRPISWFYDDVATDESERANTNKGIPLIPLEAFASPGEPHYDDIHDLDYYIVNEFKGCDFLIRIKGDSMSPRYASGDVVACKKIMEMLYFQWGRVYVLYTQSNGIMIKRLQPSEKEDCIRCVSDNEKYAPFDVPKSDIVSLALVNGLVSLE